RRAASQASGRRSWSAPPPPTTGPAPPRAPKVRESRTLRLLERIAPNSGHGNLDEGVLLRGMARRAPRPQRIDPLLEEREVLLLTRPPHLRQRRLEKEVLRARAILGPPLQPQLQRLAQLLLHVGGVVPVPVHPAPVHLGIAIGDLGHRRLEAAQLPLDRLRARLRRKLDEPSARRGRLCSVLVLMGLGGG